MLKNILILCCIVLLSCGGRNKQIYNITDKVNYSDFQIIYSDGGTDNYSSKDSIFSRFYLEGTTKIKCSITVSDKIKILKSMEDNEFLDLPDVLPEDRNGECMMPAFPVKITAIFGKIQKSVTHEGMCDVKHMDQLTRFEKILNVIEKAIYSKKEIIKLKQTNMVFM